MDISQARALVERQARAWEEGNLDAIVAAFTDDAHNESNYT